MSTSKLYYSYTTANENFMFLTTSCSKLPLFSEFKLEVRSYCWAGCAACLMWLLAKVWLWVGVNASCSCLSARDYQDYQSVVSLVPHSNLQPKLFPQLWVQCTSKMHVRVIWMCLFQTYLWYVVIYLAHSCVSGWTGQNCTLCIPATGCGKSLLLINGLIKEMR